MARKSLRQDIEAAADGAGGADEPSSKVEDFLDCVAKYDKEFEKWVKRAEKVQKRYRDEGRENRTSGEAKFNILWSNVQTLVPATFSKLPQPDVSRRFKDQDPVGRVASMLLERSLEFEITHYADYRSTMRQCVMDRFLGGRGTAWIRYEPHFKAEKGQPDDGVQVTEDTDEAPLDEALDYECAPVDYVHWRDFGHDVARTWEEVTRVWRKVYMSEEAVKARFGSEIAKTLPYDASPEKSGRQDEAAKETQKKQALVFELWDKADGKAYWFSKSQKKILDEKDDPLGLQDFFPCPRPLYSTLTNDTLVPVPDFTLYQDQANELDVLADRIDGLAKMLQLKGVYDASVPELGRLFTEGENGTLIPGGNWQAFSEKNGLKGSLQLVELKPIAEALAIAADTMEQVKSQVYEITGISDIIRGQTSASETATAQQIKGQYASLRLRSMQDEVARFATECLQLKAQVICGRFSPSTIAAISAADQLSDEDKPQVYVAPPMPPVAPGMQPMQQPQPIPAGPAMALLVGQERLADPKAESPNPMRSFRIEVAADTLVQLDEQQEKQDRIEFVTAVGTYIEKAAPVIQVSPASGPLLMELLKFGVRGFKVGKGIEGQFDAAIDQLKQAAMAGPPPDPAAMQEQAMQAAKAQVAQENATKEIGLNKKAMDLDLREQKFAADQQIAAQQRQAEDQQRAMQAEQEGAQRQEAEGREKMAFEREKLDKEIDRDILIAEIGSDAKAEKEGAEGKPRRKSSLAAMREEQAGAVQRIEEQVEQIAQSQAALVEEMRQFVQAMTAHAQSPAKVHRGMDGKMAAVEKGGRMIPIERGPDGKVIGMGTLQ